MVVAVAWLNPKGIGPRTAARIWPHCDHDRETSLHISKQFGRRAGRYVPAALAAAAVLAGIMLVFLDGLSYQP